MWFKRNARIFKRAFESKEKVAQFLLMCVAKCASSRDKFGSARFEGILHNWKASLIDERPKSHKRVVWVPLELVS